MKNQKATLLSIIISFLFPSEFVLNGEINNVVNITFNIGDISFTDEGDYKKIISSTEKIIYNITTITNTSLQLHFLSL